MDKGKWFQLRAQPQYRSLPVYTADPKGESLYICYKTDNIDLTLYHCPQAGT